MNKVKAPGLSDFSLSHAMFNAPGFEPATQTSDGEDTRELHHPPNEHLHAEQRVAHP